MNIREIIRKARQSAKTPHDLLLPDCFEEYLDLLETRSKACQEDWPFIEVRLRQSLSSLKEAVEGVAISHGINLDTLIEHFSDPKNIDPSFARPGQELGIFSIEKTANLPKIKKINKNIKA